MQSVVASLFFENPVKLYISCALRCLVSDMCMCVKKSQGPWLKKSLFTEKLRDVIYALLQVGEPTLRRYTVLFTVALDLIH